MADGPGQERQGSWQQYDWIRESNVMIPLRDGVRLATDIYRPARNGRPVEGRFPVLVERTPYNKERLEHRRGREVLRAARVRRCGPGCARSSRL